MAQVKTTVTVSPIISSSLSLSLFLFRCLSSVSVLVVFSLICVVAASAAVLLLCCGFPFWLLFVLRLCVCVAVVSRFGAICSLHEDLQARCFKPVRAPRLTAENRLERLNFCRDVLQRVGVFSVRGKMHLKPLDLTRVLFSDEKFFRWNCTGPSQNSPIWVVGEHGAKGRSRSRFVHQRPQPAQPRHHGGRRDGERHRFPSVLHRRGCAHQHRREHSDAGRRVLATLHGAPWHSHVELVVAGRQRPKAFLKESEIQLLTWLPCSPDLSPLDFHLWQEWETALGDRQLTSRLELRAMIVRTLSALDPEA